MGSSPSLFWSYAHADNQAERGRVLALANHIRDEYALITGDDLDVFVDRKAISWGDRWREVIDEALLGSTAFVSVVTPRYVRSEECRREFVEFRSHAESLGVGSLVLPVLYADVPALAEDSTDELMAIVAKTQYVNWQSLRLAHVDSEVYRQAVHDLALRIRDIMSEAQTASANQIARRSNDQSADTDDALAAIASIESQLPAWLRAVEDDTVQLALYKAMSKNYEERRQKTPKQAQLALLHRRAKDALPIIERGRDLARTWSASTIELHPSVLIALRHAREHPSILDSLTPFRQAVQLAVEQVEESLKPREGKIWASDYWEHHNRLGGVFRQIWEVELESNRYRHEGNQLVLHWHQELANLP
ncbi:toll/interleukin-1 receptor domain-containing protein [Microbacterium sp. NPDC089180]|uniref:toll/interleukin-1 receptor domain-containing protein n=1 Tax=unclassified Microbacterium TaxID=2609290 RepID=UPI00341DFF4B